MRRAGPRRAASIAIESLHVAPDRRLDPDVRAVKAHGRGSSAVLGRIGGHPALPREIAGGPAALPGGDPLAAALAAGVIPSPELVAPGTAVPGISRRVAAILVACIVAGVLTLARL